MIIILYATDYNTRYLLTGMKYKMPKTYGKGSKKDLM